MKRREAIQLFAAATAATLASARSFSQNDKAAQKLRVLILGGTGFLGPHFVQALQAGGHRITLFNRGRSNPGLFKDLETLIGDRDGKLDALEGRDWDVVIDDSGYVPRQVKLSAELLEDHVRHYLFISSISVYGTFPKPGLNEDDKVAEPPDAKVEEVTNETSRAFTDPARRSCGRTTSSGRATARIVSRIGSRAPHAAARCLRRAARTIPCNTSTCATSPRSCVTAPNSAPQVASMPVHHRAHTRWAS
jgi:NADPH:quinone reductase-like Zn-dependent oxidoreductase